jgi:hypothetical protein
MPAGKSGTYISSSTQIAPGVLGYELIEENTLTSTATSVSFTGLSLKGDYSSYRLYSSVGLSAASNISFYFNSDTTATNYYVQTFQASGGATAASRANSSLWASFGAAGDFEYVTDIYLTKEDYIFSKSSGSKALGSGVTHDVYTNTTAAAKADLTSIDITGTGANAIEAGSNFRLYGCKSE